MGCDGEREIREMAGQRQLRTMKVEVGLIRSLDGALSRLVVEFSR
jgi:hypothetical protein